MDHEFLWSLIYNGLLLAGIISAFVFGATRLSDISNNVVRPSNPGPGEIVSTAFMLVCLGIGIVVEFIFLMIKIVKLGSM